MSRTTYFIVSTFLGYICAILVGYQLWGDPFMAIFQMKSANNGLIPILSGILTSILIAFLFFGRRVQRNSFWMNALVAPLGIFLPGAMVGCALNFLLNATMAQPNFSLIYEWFLKPLTWICYLGSVYSLILGIILFFTVYRPFVRK